MLIKITYSSGIPDEEIECPDGSDVHAVLSARFGHPNVLAQLGGMCKQWEEAFAAELKKAESKVADLFHHTSAPVEVVTTEPVISEEVATIPAAEVVTETVKVKGKAKAHA